MESYEIAVKQRTRQKLKKLIKKTFGSRSDLKILCLPGPEALEIKEVYDKLGIDREGIYCLEYDEISFKRLKRNPYAAKCNLFKYSLTDFISFGRPDRNIKFDVISLDFTGHLGSYYEDIFELVKREHLAKKCVVLTNFSGAREQRPTKDLYEHYALFTDSAEIPKDSLPTLVHHALSGLHIIDSPFLELKSPKWFVDKWFRTLFESGGITDEDIEELMSDPDGIGLDFPKHVWTVFTSLLHFKYYERSTTHCGSYKYVSSNGCPMLFDLWQTNSNSDMLPLLNEVPDPKIDYSSTMDKLISTKVFRGKKALDLFLLLNREKERYADRISHPFRPLVRAHLGCESEFKKLIPQAFSEEQKKDAIIQELLSGADPAVVALKYHTSARTIAAYKAHVTMGTYSDEAR